jgi:hypothetical protein
MKRLDYSLTPPMHCSMVSSPMGLLVNGGPKHAFINCTNWGQVGRLPLRSIQWNHN